LSDDATHRRVMKHERAWSGFRLGILMNLDQRGGFRRKPKRINIDGRLTKASSKTLCQTISAECLDDKVD
jgi:hypothetical protein